MNPLKLGSSANLIIIIIIIIIIKHLLVFKLKAYTDLRINVRYDITVKGQDCIIWLLKYEGYNSYKVYWMICLIRRELGLVAVDKFIGT